MSFQCWRWKNRDVHRTGLLDTVCAESQSRGQRRHLPDGSQDEREPAAHGAVRGKQRYGLMLNTKVLTCSIYSQRYTALWSNVKHQSVEQLNIESGVYSVMV